jgi:hypothetical protein
MIVEISETFHFVFIDHIEHIELYRKHVQLLKVQNVGLRAGYKLYGCKTSFIIAVTNFL